MYFSTDIQCMFVTDNLCMYKNMYIFFKRTILEQTDSILCLNKILGKNCKIQKTYNRCVPAMFFGDITYKQIKIYQIIVFKGKMHGIID